MQEGRFFPVLKKATIVISSKFDVFNKINVGDKSQIIVDGIIEGERLEEQNGSELFIKNIRILKVDLISNKSLRI